MTTGINSQTALLAIGILQPVAAKEMRAYLAKIFSKVAILPPIGTYTTFLDELELSGRVISFRYGSARLYSLTAAGSHELTARARRVRDKRRLYLLRAAHQHKFSGSRGVSSTELAGALPASDARSSIKVSEAKKPFGLAEEQGQKSSWPRIQWQFIETGPESAAPRDTFPPLLSFLTRADAARAIDLAPEEFQLDLTGLGAIMGVSPKLIAQMILNPSRHYRSFLISKRGGGTREIESPRVFLKVIQWALLEFVLNNLRISEATHAYRSGKSIVSNALSHEGKRFVAGVDIKDFFGSVTTDQIQNLFLRHGYQAQEAELLAKLCTKDGKLPQGAPTSPILSNAVLFDFDEWAIGCTKNNHLIYTRYADDITISSDSRDVLSDFMLRVEERLRTQYALQLNERKTRIASDRGRQVVTGVVVNERATPSRDHLRKIRAIFHKASLSPKTFVGRMSELAGFIGYMNQFPKFRGSESVRNYYAVLAAVKRTARKSRRTGRRRVANAR